MYPTGRRMDMIKVNISSHKELWGYSREEAEKIKDDLTLNNPEYENAVKHSPWGTTLIPKYLFYYTEMNGILVVPRGYRIPFEHKIVEDTRLNEKVKYPKFMLKLRDTQKEAADAYLNSDMEDGMFVLPTAKGKTLLIIYIATKLQAKTLIIVQKDDQIDNCKLDIIKALNLRPKQIGLVKGKVFRLGKWITLTTIQTLVRLGSKELKQIREHFSMIATDEMHHIGAKSYDVLSTMPGRHRTGFTATDMRTDGLDPVMRFYLGNVIFNYEEQADDPDIISAKDVSVIVKNSNIVYNPIQLYTANAHAFYIKEFNFDDELKRIKFVVNNKRIITDLYVEDKCYKFDDDDIDYYFERLATAGVIKRKPIDFSKVREAIETNEEFNTMVAKDVIAEVKKKKSCLVFCFEVEHCEYIKALLIENGLSEKLIQVYHGKMKAKKIDIKRRAESKEKLVTIATFKIATEGTNVLTWERVFFAMTFNNEKDVTQTIGRARRKFEGKDDVIVYDYRHPFVKGARSHGNTRDKVYKKKGFKIKYPLATKPFNRGFKYITQRRK
jgi:superfamily II DNA or RNA helicase